MRKSRVFLILSGVFLLCFASLVNLIFLTDVIGFIKGKTFDTFRLCGFAASVILVIAGIILIVGKQKVSAIMVLSAAAFYYVYSFPQTASYFSGTIEQYGQGVDIPRYFVLCPLCAIISLLLFAASLLLRGKVAPVLAILSVCFGMTAFVLQFRFFGYIAGHPTILNLLPLNLFVSEIFAGVHKIKAE